MSQHHWGTSDILSTWVRSGCSGTRYFSMEKGKFARIVFAQKIPDAWSAFRVIVKLDGEDYEFGASGGEWVYEKEKG